MKKLFFGSGMIQIDLSDQIFHVSTLCVPVCRTWIGDDRKLHLIPKSFYFRFRDV